MSDRQRPTRERGHYIPAEEVEIYLANGWTIIDSPPGIDEVLMKPPATDIAA